MTDADRPLVLCLVGTDHHPFARLISWCDALASQRDDIEVLVQYGHSTPPDTAHGEAFLDKAALTAALERAHVAVTHGGPGLISDVRSAGLAPLVVARNPDLGEHVDGHQMRFTARLASSGIIRSLDSEEEFVDAVSAELAATRGSSVDRAEDESRVATSVARFAAVVEPLVRARR